jgi:hypothetical protein
LTGKREELKQMRPPAPTPRSRQHFLLYFSWTPHQSLNVPCIALLHQQLVARTMSGIEVAGIVLATFPLVISALEHYANGVIKISNFRQYERELRSLQRDLATEQQLLSDSIRLLLRTIVASEHELESLINDPGGASWHEENFKEKLEGKLQKSYQVYMDKLEDMNEAMLDLTKRLGLKPGGQVRLQT